MAVSYQCEIGNNVKMQLRNYFKHFFNLSDYEVYVNCV